MPFTYNGTTNHFATTSGGTATVAAVTSADTVTVDSLSGNATLTVGAAWSCSALTVNNGSSTVACDATHGITATGAVTLTAGTLNTNNQTCSWGLFSSNNANTRTITMGSSAITLTASGNVWDWSSSLTITANTATITLTNANGQIGSTAINFNGTNLIWSANTAGQSNSSWTCANMTVIGTAAKTNTFAFGGAITVTGTLTLTGNSVTNRMLVQSNAVSPGFTRTISAGAVAITNCDFMDIVGTGLPLNAPWTGTSVGDALGNSNITFDTPVTQTWNGNTTGTWSTAANWTSRVPLPQDNVAISGLTSGAVTMDMPRTGKDLDCTGSTGGNLVLSTMSSYGNVSLAAGMTTSNNSRWTLAGRSALTFTANTVSLAGPLTIGILTGSQYTLGSAYASTSASVTNFNGTFNTNNFNMTAVGFQVASVASTTTLGSSLITCNGTGTVWTGAGTINPGSSTIALTDTSASAKTFAGGGKTYNVLAITGGGAGAVTITGANTFANLPQITGGTKSIVWPGSTTTTFTNGSNFGNGTNVITMTASAGSATLSFGSRVNADFLNLTNIVAAGLIPAYAGINSTNGGGNTNWVFTAAPPLGGTLLMMGIG